MSHKKTGRRHQTKGLGDITLNDFANASVAKNRIKKSNNNVSVVVKNEIETSWEDKDFDGDFVQEENEDGTLSYVIRKNDTKVRKKTISSSSDNSSEIKGGSHNYPIDIWYIISEYIHPEDVGRFAAICQTSFEVVCTARFWFNLYKRYYSSTYKLPEQLQPECLVRKYGLRTSVIRSLYFMYPPFINRVKAVTTFEQHSDILIRRVCSLVWYKKRKTYWMYYFKMKRNTERYVQHPRYSEMQQPDVLKMLDDIYANQDEDCQVLQVTCLNFIPVNVVLGLTLTSASLTLSRGYTHHRLQLVFNSGIHSASVDGPGSTSVILDPVANIKILDWWHPLYPHLTHNIGVLLNQE